MKKCYCCGADVPDNAKFCPKCGKTMEITRELIDRAEANDPDAQTELYERTYKTVYTRIRAKVPDEDTVMDIMQETYLSAFTNLDLLQKAETFPSWLLTIATRKVCDWYRKNGKENENVQMSGLEYENDDTISDEDDVLEKPEYREDFSPDESLDRAETGRLLSEILNTLPEDQRIVLVMRYYDEMSLKEISEELGVNLSTVKTRLTAGKKKVEAKVLELEKSGTKLYSLGPVAFLVFLLHHAELFAPAISAHAIVGLTAAGAGAAAGGTAAGAAAHVAAGVTGKAAAGTTVKAAAGAAAKGLGVKIGAAAAAVVVAGGVTTAVIVAANAPTAIDLNHYVTVEFWGYNDYGQAACEFDTEEFLDDYAGKIQYKENENAAGSSGENIETDLAFWLSNCFYLSEYDNLSNGDPVSLSWTVDTDTVESLYDVKLNYKEEDYVVNNLEKIGEHQLKSVTRYDNKTGSLSEIIEYYPNGEISLDETYTSSGDISTRYEYTFDKYGRVATETQYAKDQGYSGPISYTYDEAGNLLAKYTEANGYAVLYKYQYDDEGRVVQYYEDYDWTYRGTSENGGNGAYTASELIGQMTTIFSTPSSDFRGYYYTYTYDDSDHVILETKTQYDLDMTVKLYRETEYTYDEEGRLLSSSYVEYHNGEFDSGRSATYEEHGYELGYTLINSINPSGYSKTYQYTYDDEGNVIRWQNDTIVVECTYDENGHLLSRKSTGSSPESDYSYVNEYYN